MSEFKQIGTVEEVGDTVCLVRGLPHVTMEEEVVFESGTHGLVLRLDEDYIHVVILGDAKSVRRGDYVTRTGMAVSTPVGDELLGRVVNPLGVPIDGKTNFQNTTMWPIERKAPTIFQRKPVTEQIATGLLQIDGLLPIGKGQRATIIGDPKSGKSSTIYTAMVNMAKANIITVYVAIGKSQSQIKTLSQKLGDLGVADKVVIVMATAAMSPTLNYIAPYTGCTIGEYFMENGKDVMLIYDDLSQHAKAYRQMALLLKRPPGREAYPGDIFYIHSRLLERAAQLNDELGGGSMAALPVIEALERDLSGYVATNVLSITDGHILFDMTMFTRGIMPAIAIELSVSRLGGKVQCDVLKRTGVKIARALMQYREAQAFASFGTDLAEETRNRIIRGERTIEFLKQKVYEGFTLVEQILMFYGLTEGFFDHLKVEMCHEARSAFLEFSNRPEFATLKTDVMTEKLDSMKVLLDEFLKSAKTVIEPFEMDTAVDEDAAPPPAPEEDTGKKGKKKEKKDKQAQPTPTPQGRFFWNRLKKKPK